MLNKFEGVKALAFVAIMTALCSIFVFGTMYIPLTTILILLIIPLCTTFVVLKVDYRYVLIYFSASTLISCVDILNALFVVIPSLITGITMGILLKKYLHGYITIFATSVILIFLQVIAQILIKLIFSEDMMLIMGTLLRIREEIFSYIYYLFLFVISLAQATLSYEITSNELKKLNYQFNEKKNLFIPAIIITFILGVTSLVLSLVTFRMAYLFFGFTLYFTVVLGYYNFSFYNKKMVLLLQCPLYGICFIGFMALFTVLNKEYAIFSLLLFPLSEILVALTIIIYQKFIKKGKINETLFD